MEWNAKRCAMGIIAAILAVGTMISGTIMWSVEKREEILHLRDKSACCVQNWPRGMRFWIKR